MPRFPKALILMLTLLAGAGTALAQDEDQIPPRGQMGKVVIKTAPEKALAYLGGEKLGFTPVEMDFASGRHTLTLMLNGEELVNKRINVWPSQTTVVDTALAMPYGSMMVTVSPANARLTVDEEEVGNVPAAGLRVNNLEAGTRVVRVSKGRRSKEVKVDILPEENVKVHIDLNKK